MGTIGNFLDQFDPRRDFGYYGGPMPESDTRKRVVISLDIDAELDQLCVDNENAEKQWLTGILLRYGIEHSVEAIEQFSSRSVERTLRRRSAATCSTSTVNDGVIALSGRLRKSPVK